MELNDITYKVRGCIFKVHATLGPGLLEKVYQAALAYEIRKAGLHVEEQTEQPVRYDEVFFHVGFYLDLVIENQVVVQIKSVKELQDVDKKTVLTYLRLSGKKLGILVNFNAATLVDKESLFRIIN